ncbi:hypothetical protein ET013_00405 [Lactococcus garvieae]|nr:hypothetical protein [Lactococcus garvieae]NHJ06789.1 hypothetical protein [Lactococcus garvieae]
MSIKRKFSFYVFSSHYYTKFFEKNRNTSTWETGRLNQCTPIAYEKTFPQEPTNVWEGKGVVGNQRGLIL